MKHEISIRSARLDDAEAISSLIVKALEQTNSKDYSLAILEQITRKYSVPQVRNSIRAWDVLVVWKDDKIVGTASLCGSTIRQMYVLPDCQGLGIGASLMKALEEKALASGITKLDLHSSITAKKFYARFGFVKAGDDEYFGPARVIVMEKLLRRHRSKSRSQPSSGESRRQLRGAVADVSEVGQGS